MVNRPTTRRDKSSRDRKKPILKNGGVIKLQNYDDFNQDTEFDQIDPNDHDNFMNSKRKNQSQMLPQHMNQLETQSTIYTSQNQNPQNRKSRKRFSEILPNTGMKRSKTPNPQQFLQSARNFNKESQRTGRSSSNRRRRDKSPSQVKIYRKKPKSKIDDLSESMLKEQISEAMPDFAAMRRKSDAMLSRRGSQASHISNLSKNSDQDYIDKLKSQLRNKNKHIQNLQKKMDDFDGSQIGDDDLAEQSEFKFRQNPYINQDEDDHYEDESMFNYSRHPSRKFVENVMRKGKAPKVVTVETYFEPTESTDFEQDEQRVRNEYSRSRLHKLEDRFEDLKFDMSHTSYHG